MKVVNLPPRITIDKAGDLRKMLEEVLRKNHSVMLQVSDIQEIDAAGLQLLSSVLLWGAANNVQVDFTGVIPTELEIALLASGFCRTVPHEGRLLKDSILSTVGGGYAG